MRGRLVVLTAGLLAAAATPASADTLIAAAPGARNLTSGNGYMAWAAPAANGRWQLAVRAPDGTVTTPSIPDFGAAPDPWIGSDSPRYPHGFVAVYSRCKGTSATSGCDVYAFDLKAGTERKVTEISSASASETAPSVARGAWVFVRRDGSKPGVYAYTEHRGVRRASKTIGLATASNGTRFTYTYKSSAGGGVAVRRFSGDGGVITLTSKRPTVPRSPVSTRYKVGWLEPAATGTGQEVHWSSRISGHSLVGSPIRIATRTLPASTDSIATGGLTPPPGAISVSEPSRITHYLDAKGVEHIVPELKF